MGTRCGLPCTLWIRAWIRARILPASACRSPAGPGAPVFTRLAEAHVATVVDGGNSWATCQPPDLGRDAPELTAVPQHRSPTAEAINTTQERIRPLSDAPVAIGRPGRQAPLLRCRLRQGACRHPRRRPSEQGGQLQWRQRNTCADRGCRHKHPRRRRHCRRGQQLRWAERRPRRWRRRFQSQLRTVAAMDCERRCAARLGVRGERLSRPSRASRQARQSPA